MNRKIVLGLLGLIGAGGLLAAAGPVLGQSAPATRSDSAQDLTGFWGLRFDSRTVPGATLVAGIGSKQLAQHQAADRHAIRWCQPVGMPALMDASSPIGIVQGSHEVTVSTEVPSAPRHIYLNREPPDPAVFEPTTNGFSTAHWEGRVLVVETTGFNDKGETLIPGGGFRSPTARLTERFELMHDGSELQVSSSWTDPKVYAKPHHYVYRYIRLPESFNFGEFFCDSNDADRASFLTTAPDANAPVSGVH